MTIATEELKKMDGLFSDTRPVEAVKIEQVMNILGASIRKTAAECKEKNEATERMQRAFLLCKCVEVWADDESASGEEISIPVDLMKAVQLDTDGEDADVFSISEAMATVKKMIGESDESDSSDSNDNQEPADWNNLTTDLDKDEDEDEKW